MNFILIFAILFLHGNSLNADESDLVRFENFAKSILNEVKELKQENVALKQTIKDFEAKVDDNLEQRVEKLEQLSKYKTLRTCQEYADRGLTKSGIYEIDPDGDGIGFAPITVHCNFATNETQIFHDKEDMIKIEKCSTGPGCSVYDFNYDAPMEQIQALIDLSQHCYQDLAFGCYLAPLRFDDVDLGFWTDKSGIDRYFFHGDNIGNHVCKCGTDHTCVDSSIENLACNCDSKSPTWYEDIGRITSKEILPITKFSYGPLQFDSERANITVGRLTCSGAKQVDQHSISCNSWKLKGSIINGIYILKEEHETPRLGYCEMSKNGYFDTDLETTFGFVETLSVPDRVIFSVFSEAKNFELTGDLTFDRMIMNVGDGMDMINGAFTTPTDGSYVFSFFVQDSANTKPDQVMVFINDTAQFFMRNFDENQGHNTFGYTWLFALKKGDKVKLKANPGALYTNGYVRMTFTGYLLKSE